MSIFHNNTCTGLEAELLKFPNGKHDDMIDSLSSAVNMLNTFNIANIIKKVIVQKRYF
jgi:phage terminase large subunit-like protein